MKHCIGPNKAMHATIGFLRANPSVTIVYNEYRQAHNVTGTIHAIKAPYSVIVDSGKTLITIQLASIVYITK